MIIVLLVLVAMGLLILLVVLAAAVLAGGCTGAALGGMLPLLLHKPVFVKGVPQPDVFGQVIRGTLGMVVGGLSGALIGLAIAALGIWVLFAGY